LKKGNLPHKTYDIREIRQEHPRAYESWTEAEEEQLKQLYKESMSISDIAKKLQRKPGGISSRLKKLGLLF
jgi:hypothetical protein